MLYAKFVTKELQSPGCWGKINYGPFPQEIFVDAAPQSAGQCAEGIHVIPLTESIDFTNIIWSKTVIILEAGREDIAYQERDGKVRLRHAKSLRFANEDELALLRRACVASGCADHAVNMANNIGGTDALRTAACRAPYAAFTYASWVDKFACDETRTGACANPESAVFYADCIDREPRNDTRNAALLSPRYAYEYAKLVDKAFRADTWAAVQDSAYYTYQYRNYLGHDPNFPD